MVNEDNYQIYPQFVDELLTEFPANQININLYRNGYLGGPPVKPAVLERFKQAVDRYERHLVQGSVKKFRFLGARAMRWKEILQKELIYRVATTNDFVTPCTAGTLNYVIWEDGSVGPC